MAMEFVTIVIAALEKLQIRYMVVGAFSSNVYGEPRSTKDADFVIELKNQSLDLLVKEIGADFKLDPQISFETITSTMRYRLAHQSTGFTIELFLLSNDPHDQARFGRRLQRNIGDGRSTFVPTAEDVIITKLRWSKHGRRQKDMDDVAAVMAVQAGHLDLEYIRGWCDEHQTRDIFERLLEETRPYEIG
jgi:hypothetical protein